MAEVKSKILERNIIVAASNGESPSNFHADLSKYPICEPKCVHT